MTSTAKPSNSRVPAYLAIAFGWTWACWIGGWALSTLSGHQLRPGATLFELFDFLGSGGFPSQLLFALGVFGPLLGYLAVRRYQPFLGTLGGWPLLLTAIVPLISVLPAVVLSALFVPVTEGLTFGAVAAVIGLYAVSNFLTSETEEFGWRGFLYPALKLSQKSFWANAWKGGLLWAAWHFPLLVIMYWSLGFAMLPTIAGFTASIIAMNYITNAIYEQSRSILLCMLLHALNNTATFALVLIFPSSPFTIIVAIMAWVFVGILERKLRIDQSAPREQR